MLFCPHSFTFNQINYPFLADNPNEYLYVAGIYITGVMINVTLGICATVFILNYQAQCLKQDEGRTFPVWFILTTKLIEKCLPKKLRRSTKSKDKKNSISHAVSPSNHEMTEDPEGSLPNTYTTGFREDFKDCKAFREKAADTMDHVISLFFSVSLILLTIIMMFVYPLFDKSDQMDEPVLVS